MPLRLRAGAADFHIVWDEVGAGRWRQLVASRHTLEVAILPESAEDCLFIFGRCFPKAPFIGARSAIQKR